MMPRHFLWIGAIAGILGATVILHVALLIVAVGDPSFAVEPDYEQVAANWDEHQRIVRQSDALGWSVDLTAEPNAAGGMRVGLDVRDRGGAPVRGATVEVRGVHVARAAHPTTLRPAETSPGRYAAECARHRAGIWEFRLDIVRGTDHFVGTKRVFVAARGSAAP